MFIGSLLHPEVGDIVERYRLNDNRLVGVFLVTEADNPVDAWGNERRDVIRVTCMFNDDFGTRYSMYQTVNPGDSTWIHTVHLMDNWNAEESGTSHYYKIKKDK